MDQTPDYIYDPENWEATYEYNDIGFSEDGMDKCSIRRLATLIKGPDKFAAMVPDAVDDSGEPDDCTVELFDTREEAQTAIDSALAKLRAAISSPTP